MLYFLIHRYQGGNFYSFLKTGSPGVVGIGDGQGCTVNVGWPHKGMGDAEYVGAWETILLPLVLNCDPDLVLVSMLLGKILGNAVRHQQTLANSRDKWKRTLRQLPK